MASFNGATFYERGTGDRSYPTWDATMLLAIKPRPNEDSVIQEIGADVQKLALGVQVTAAELAALYDQLHESGTLIMNWETCTAFLSSISPGQQIGIGNDLYLSGLNFIFLASITPSGAFLDEGGGAFLDEGGSVFLEE